MSKKLTGKVCHRLAKRKGKFNPDSQYIAAAMKKFSGKIKKEPVRYSSAVSDNFQQPLEEYLKPGGIYD